MSCAAVVVDAHNWVDVFFAERTHKVVCSLLHLWVGTLNGIELNTVRVAACVYRTDRAAAKSDAIVVATYHYNLVACLWLFLQAVALRSVAYTACKHDYLVVGIFSSIVGLVFSMLECENRTAD